MRHRWSLPALASMLALVLVLLGCWVWWNRPQPLVASQQRALAAAQDRWAQRSFTHYRFVLERRIDAPASSNPVSSFRDQTCQQKIDVDGERVVVVRHLTCPVPAGTSMDATAGGWHFRCTDISASCPPAPMTVDDLFGTIDTYLKTPRCGPNGCGCDGRFVYETEYDAALGYPVHMELRMLAPVIGSRPCTTIGWFIPEPALTVLQLVPEPVP